MLCGLSNDLEMNKKPRETSPWMGKLSLIDEDYGYLPGRQNSIIFHHRGNRKDLDLMISVIHQP
jgi:hypothetical protein